MYDGSWLFAGKTHPQRILDRHIGYLVDYFLHIHESDLSAFLNEEEKTLLLNSIYDELDLYWKFYKKITKSHKEYFRNFTPSRQTHRLRRIDESREGK
jgi:hypothetical protein